jgi:hypothetical protein
MAGNIGAGATGLLSGITGFFQKKQGNRLLKNNPFPTEGMPPEELANQQIAQNAALEGMPSEQYQAAQKNIQRSQAASLGAALDRRSGVSQIGAIQEGTNTAQGNLDAQSAEMRRQNVGQLLGVNNQVASWRDKLFDWNQRAKYEQNRQYAMSLIGAGNANMMSGADKLIGGLVGAGAGGALSGKGGAAPTGGASGPGMATSYASMPTVDQSGGVTSPAAQYSQLNPNAYANLIGG